MPVVTKNIIIISVLLFAATYLTQDSNLNLYDYLGLHHHLAPTFKPHQFVTYIFMHGSFMHIFFNMFGVYMFGQVLEQVWGPKKFLIFYILTGLGAAVTQYIIMHIQITENLDAINQNINLFIEDANYKAMLINQKYEYLNANVIVGASGSLFGMLGAYGLLFPNQLLYIYFLIPIKAKWIVIIYGGLELLLGLSNQEGDNVAHFAHVGGLFVGLIIVLIWKNKSKNYYS
ncbi:MAG: rhomboid family intramembrane serine protease [Sphingobacteriaceae bacterium]|nr:rhomboid family intramembrane serine protease [Sphingobacteriaceae bacterium]